MRVSLFCGGGYHGDFTGSDGFYRALPGNTCLFACVCVCWRSIYIGADDEEPLVFVYFTKNSNPTFHPNYTDLYMMV